LRPRAPVESAEEGHPIPVTTTTPTDQSPSWMLVVLIGISLALVVLSAVGWAHTNVAVLLGLLAGLLTFVLEVRKNRFSRRSVAVGLCIPIIAVVIVAAEHRQHASKLADQLKAARGAEVLLAGTSASGGARLELAADGISQSSQLDSVTVEPFWIDRFEVTNRQFLVCVETRHCAEPADRAALEDRAKTDWPVVSVTAKQAYDFCDWVGRRLPTEVEWVFAADGPGVSREWPWGSDPLDPSRADLGFVQTDTTSTGQPAPPADPAFDPNATAPSVFGSEDSPLQGGPVPESEKSLGQTPDGVSHLLGNVWEWTSTSSDLCPDHADCATPWNPTLSEKAPHLVTRGQAWTTPVDLGHLDEFAHLVHDPAPVLATFATNDLGFRCARSDR
jgi:formylglycine-generating enzyme required for sulfatase activity